MRIRKKDRSGSLEIEDRSVHTALFSSSCGDAGFALGSRTISDLKNSPEPKLGAARKRVKLL